MNSLWFWIICQKAWRAWRMASPVWPCHSSSTTSPTGSLSVFTIFHPQTDLIFLNITNIISEEKIVMWRNFSFPCMTIVGKLKISLHVEKFQMSPHDRCGEIWNSSHMACVWCRRRCHICKIYAIFCHNLRAFMWRKIEPKTTFVEKKWQIWDVILTSLLCAYDTCDERKRSKA